MILLLYCWNNLILYTVQYVVIFCLGLFLPSMMFNQCMGMISSCLYGDVDWTSPSPDIPASQPIPDVILDTTTMGQEAVVVKNGMRLCGTGSARASSPILQVYYIIFNIYISTFGIHLWNEVVWHRSSIFLYICLSILVSISIFIYQSRIKPTGR